MKCIAIGTTSSNLNIALINGDDVFTCKKEIGKSGHSAMLMPLVDEMLKSHNVDISEIDTVGVVVGPGSFTGIRIGVSAMTAIAFANNAKRISVTSFELIAYNRANILTAVDAGHGNLYVAHCVDGKVVDTSFVEAKGANSIENAVFESEFDLDKVLAKVVIEKANNGEFVNVFEPFYMRKSQAEREKDEI